MSFLESLWLVFEIFVFVAYLLVLLSIVQDLFRDRKLGGWAKAIWFLFLIFVPFITALVYIIARGSGIPERRAVLYAEAQSQADAYIRSVATATPADQIKAAKELLDAGTISAAEFDALKAKALG